MFQNIIGVDHCLRYFGSWLEVTAAVFLSAPMWGWTYLHILLDNGRLFPRDGTEAQLNLNSRQN